MVMEKVLVVGLVFLFRNINRNNCRKKMTVTVNGKRNINKKRRGRTQSENRKRQIKRYKKKEVKVKKNYPPL